jgi:hypothetical protein
VIGPWKAARRRVRIGFAHDLFRSPPLGQWNPAGQARWLQTFLMPAMEAADSVVQDALEGVRANAVAWAAERVVAGVLPPGAEGWALLYGGELPAGGDVWFRTMLGYDLLVGYEMSANQLRFLRIASSEMLLTGRLLPHLICSPPYLNGGDGHEADQHGDA